MESNDEYAIKRIDENVFEVVLLRRMIVLQLIFQVFVKVKILLTVRLKTLLWKLALKK